MANHVIRAHTRCRQTGNFSLTAIYKERKTYVEKPGKKDVEFFSEFLLTENVGG
jgi:hypothetical protein